MSSQTSSFIERFKYDVISSSLLSSSISAPHPIGQRSTSPAIPGRLSPIPDSENYTVDQLSPSTLWFLSVKSTILGEDPGPPDMP